MFLNYLVEHNRYANIIGIMCVLAILFVFSRNRAAIHYLLIIKALAMQVVIGLLVLKTTLGKHMVLCAVNLIASLYMSAGEGAQFLFGNLCNADSPWGFIFAIKVLPILIFFGAFMSLLFYWGIVQKLVNGVGILIQPILGTSGAETLCAIANSFLDQTGSPLLIKHYLPTMTRSELLLVMVSGMGSISGAILVVFSAMGVPVEHLLAASMMAIPSSILVAKMLCPETEEPLTQGTVKIQYEQDAYNMLDAVARGTLDGLQLALTIGAMLISFLGLLSLINYFLVYVSVIINLLLTYFAVEWHIPVLSIQLVCSYLFLPFGYLLGFTGQEARLVSQLIGTKVAVNEVVAYSSMLAMPLSSRAVSLTTYALCGFSNFSCIGIQIGSIGALAPHKRHQLSELGLYAVLGGTMANILSALIAGLIL